MMMCIEYGRRMIGRVIPTRRILAGSLARSVTEYLILMSRVMILA